MAVSEAVRREVEERDEGLCQFWHKEPTPGDQVSHFIHQGIGGLPPEHELNQKENLAWSCGLCHERFPRWRWLEFRPTAMPSVEYLKTWRDWWEKVRETIEAVPEGDVAARAMGLVAIPFAPPEMPDQGCMRIVSPKGVPSKPTELWFYNRWRWAETEIRFEMAKSRIATERAAALEVAAELQWLKDHGLAQAVNKSADYLDLAAQLGLSSTKAKKRVRVARFYGGLLDVARGVDLDVLDSIRSAPEEDLREVAGWFADLHPAEARSRFNAKYAKDSESLSTFTGIEGAKKVEQVKAADEEKAKELLAKRGVHVDTLMRASSIIEGIDRQAE